MNGYHLPLRVNVKRQQLNVLVSIFAFATGGPVLTILAVLVALTFQPGDSKGIIGLNIMFGAAWWLALFLASHNLIAAADEKGPAAPVCPHCGKSAAQPVGDGLNSGAKSRGV